MVEVKSLSKRFKLPKRSEAPRGTDVREDGGWFHAVRNVSFQCGAGEILGLLGPNGAGKTTSLRMLSTALAPSSGQVLVDGIDLVADPETARRRFGFLSGSTGLYGRLTVRENIRYFGEAHGMHGRALAARIDELLTRLDMASYADKRADSLSAGMRQRALIARTVVHSPNVLILDEPTTGLDILGARLVLDFMREQQMAGAAIIFSTHQLHEIEALCRRVCIVNLGETVFEGPVDALQRQGSLADAYLAQLGEAPTQAGDVGRTQSSATVTVGA